MKIYKTGEFAKKLNTSVKTLQRWDREGTLRAYRNPKGRRYYTEEQYEKFMGIEQRRTEGKIVIYARVSSEGQKDGLDNQIRFLREFANAKGWIVDDVLTDIGSGLNYNRKKWNALIDESMNGDVSKVIVAHKDRFIRFGFDWFERFLRRNGTEIVIVKNEELSPQEELIQDLVSIIHVFSCRIYGLRKYKDKIRKDELN